MLKAVKGKQATIKHVVKSGNELLLETENGNIKLVPYSDRIIRVKYTLANEFNDHLGPGLVPLLPDCEWAYTESSNTVNLKTDKIHLEIDMQTSAFAYYDQNHKLLVREPARGGKFLNRYDAYRTILDDTSLTEKIKTADGVKDVVLDAKKAFYKTLYHTKLELEWSPNEAIYGFGQQEEGSLNLRGTRQYIHQANLKIAMPFFISTNGYGMLFHTYSPLIFNDNEYGSYIYNESAAELDFYFLCGECMDDIIGGYRQVTGKATMLPLWAFGYMQSQERYENQQEIIDTVMEYRRREIPIDSIVLDWQSWESGKWGQKSFDESRFPDVPRMMDDLHTLGTHFMISIWPNMDKSSENYLEMKERDCLLQNSNIYNAFSDESRSLYWKQVDEGLFSQGIDAWWCDSSEPFTPEWTHPIKPEPDKNFVDFHDTAKTYLDEEYTNAYALMHAKSIYDGQRSATSQKRVVNLTRSGYIGQQRYGTILWSGDTTAKWKTLRDQIPAGLSMCASGIPYWTLDIGAFFVKRGNAWFWDGDYEEGCKDLGYRELYTRWFQYGAFLPVFRAHGTDTRREIWNFGEKGEPFYDTLVTFVELRYQLLPYIYSLAAMTTLNDYTMMRLLAFDFQHDGKVYGIKDQFMLGPALMVCPVTSPMYFGPQSTPLQHVPKTRSVYLPEGTDWYDFWTSQRVAGGQTINVNAEINTMPLFVRAGSILPMADSAPYSGAIVQDRFKVKIYSGCKGEFHLYQDENDNYNYENGHYTSISLQWDDSAGLLHIGERVGSYNGMPDRVSFDVEVVR
ncbi:glycoside hydrolase family 31 protein [Paenibacillus cymbidii]|uniref:glycoside hydrolase family 31 protein n=1 Tax=Paenibacillus cymbidii TaxID=1639034 RepID=UPI00107FEA8A|nr:TIM-barrel domain-containing protein [Paenibacillus cymbidii]